MPALLRTRPVSDAERLRHDRHRVAPVLATLALLAVYALLFTDASSRLGLPAPADVGAQLGFAPEALFAADGSVASPFSISWTERHDADTERLLFLAILAGAFLSAYFLPLVWKQPALVGWTLLGLCLLFGPRATASLLAAHLAVYLVFHPRAGAWHPLALAPGALAGASLAAPLPGPLALGAALGASLSFAAHALVHRGLVRPGRIRTGLQDVAAHVALLTVLAAALLEGAGLGTLGISLGVALFFWQWARLILYRIDLADGLAPERVPLARYLAVFFSPAVIPIWEWGIAIGQGYAYIQNNFLCEDKNATVWRGVKLLTLAAGYLALGAWLADLAVALASGVGLTVHGGVTRALTASFMRSGDASAAEVLATTFLDLVRWILVLGGIFHLKVAIWQLCGFRVDPVLQRPWLATNLVAFWPRITFHYREFLVRVFYYPVFFLRGLRRHPRLRIVLATLAAAGLGNLVWGHVAEGLYLRAHYDAGVGAYETLLYELSTWPYFVLLGGGIAVAELWLRARRGRRRPWTFSPRIVLDIAAAWATFQFFTLIRIFRRPAEGSDTWDQWRLFLRAFGIEL